MRAHIGLLLCVWIPLAAAGGAAESRAVVEKSLPLLQKTGPAFWNGSGCISCHNNTLPDMAIALARERGFAVDARLERDSLQQTLSFIDLRRERLMEGLGPGGGQNTVGSLLFTLAVSKVPANESLEASARYLRILQSPEGHWPVQNHRPPMVASSITLTAMATRGLRAYAPASQRPAYEASIARAVAWLKEARPLATEDYAFKIIGLKGAAGARPVIAATAADLLKLQREDGGWSQLPALTSDAYATGQALFALGEAGFGPSDAAYRRGLEFLTRTQLADGSWHVRTRSEPTQVYFEAGYPHGVDQFISAAGASWATAVLARSAATSW